MNRTRRDFLRGAIGWGGLLLAGSLELRAVHGAEPLRRAHRYLASRQSADGAWRSGRYAAFREGDVLTPVVLWAMQTAFAHDLVPGRAGARPPCFASRGTPSITAEQSTTDRSSDGSGETPKPGRRDAHPTRECYMRGLEWLRQFTDTCCAQSEPWSALHYPLFTASYAAQVLVRSGDPDRAAAWVKIIEQLRTSEGLGWLAGDPMCGAWSDASAPPQYVAPIPDMLAPNISATALAVGALAAVNGTNRARGAQPFIERCQNFSKDEPTEFDDGGFFFALDDPIRNKAGRAGRDALGRERFHSYGSATCDGYLALRACGLPREHPRVQAAANWLRQHGEGLNSGSQWAVGRAEARESLAFYHAQALAAVLADLRSTGGWIRPLGEALTAALVARQGGDGAWEGTAPDSCEDEPLLASAFALRALALLG